MQKSYYVLMSFAVFLFLSCSQNSIVREYDEVAIKPSQVEAAFTGSILPENYENPLIWKTPDRWEELPGDGMRLVTFRAVTGDQRAETTVVMIDGEAGGTEANVVRWLDQLGLNLNKQELTQFLATGELLAAKDGLVLTIYNFTILGAPQGLSMLAAIGAISGQTLFVKMSGDGEIVSSLYSDFVDLVSSIGLSPQLKS